MCHFHTTPSRETIHLEEPAFLILQRGGILDCKKEVWVKGAVTSSRGFYRLVLKPQINAPELLLIDYLSSIQFFWIHIMSQYIGVAPVRKWKSSLSPQLASHWVSKITFRL